MSFCHALASQFSKYTQERNKHRFLTIYFIGFKYMWHLCVTGYSFHKNAFSIIIIDILAAIGVYSDKLYQHVFRKDIIMMGSQSYNSPL